jgi:hypothetical protein
VVQLDSASPRAAAAARDEARAAELNRRLGERIRAATSWDELVSVLHEHGDDLNYINVALLAARAGELFPGASEPPPSAASQQHDQQHNQQQQEQQQQKQQPPQQQQQADLDRIAALVLERASWFQASHFAASAWGLSSAGLKARGFWRGFCGACERKLPALTFAQLGAVLCASASSE